MSPGQPLDASVLVLDPNATPPFDKFEALSTIEPKVRATWDKNRRDLQDQRFSGYDLSLANFAIAAGWTNQETVDLLIAFRRRHGDEPKLREDYYSLTIGRARASVAHRRAEASIDTSFMRGSQDGTGGVMNAEACWRPRARS